MTPEDLANNGYYLFPISSDGEKRPFLKWRDRSTIDPEILARWALRYPDCWWGIDCHKSGIVVLDDDRGKNPHAEGSLAHLETVHGDIPPTYTVRTMSGSYHYYFWGAGRNSASSILGKGLDSRGVGGFVVAPCSPGYTVEYDIDVADAPAWFIDLLGQTPERKKREKGDALPVGVKLDSEEALRRAATYLRDKALIAYEGDGGDLTTYQVACRVRDFGISEAECGILMQVHWNDRCEPPWDIEELRTKVANAYKYAGNEPGVATPTAVFDRFHDTPPVQMFVEANILMDREVKVDYLVEGLLETPSTGLIFGDPSAGKSFLAIDMAMAVATGGSWMGAKVKKGVSVYFAGEGRHGIRRRMKAWVEHHKTPLATNSMWISEKRIEFSAASLRSVAEELRAIEDATGERIALCVVDTLARHIPSAADENSARDAGSFINSVDWLRDEFGAVIAVVHHSGKANKDASRGSSAIRGAMDWEFRVSHVNAQRNVIFTKQKESELPPPFGFRLEQVALPGEDKTTSAVPLTCEYDPTQGRAASLGPDAVMALEILQFEGGNGCLDRKVWRGLFYDALGEETLQDTKRKKYTRAMKVLEGSGTVKFEGDKAWAMLVTSEIL